MTYATLNPTRRTLMGPGPSDTHPRVLSAISAPTLGHLDPEFIVIMDEIKEMLQKVYCTKNELTMPISATGSAGMEACLVNTIEPGDRVVIAQNGVFAGRMADIVGRLGGELVLVDAEWGKIVPVEKVISAIDGKKTKLVGIVHAETSTGVCQPLQDIAKAAHEVDALILADCVTSLGGIPVEIDNWGIDLAYSGTQKCLSCPPGLSPITFSDRAVEVLKNRKSKVASWYLDLTMLINYWGGDRIYHHTAPVNMLYGLREALILFLEEGQENVFKRHQINHKALVGGIESMGLKMLVDPEFRLPQLNTICVPDTIDETLVRQQLLQNYNIEVGAGLGSLKGKVWRVGQMGHASRRENITLFLSALGTILNTQGFSNDTSSALSRASSFYN
jgi:alanine-glyoxylate transaminase / serine-glyoxylate transaminase / serine-pyruvate transaminase